MKHITLGDLAAGIFLALLIALLVHRWPVAMASPASVPPRPQVVMGKYDPLAIYHERDRRLTITPDAPADLLVCFGEKPEHCKLVRAWVGR